MISFKQKMASFILYFFLLGIVSIISQVTIVRELITAFFGNELFTGIILGIWLLGTGLGSLLILKIFPKATKKACFLLEILFCLLLPLLILLVRYFIGITLLPGEVPSFSRSSIFMLLILFPFCFLLGGLFSLGTKTWAKKELPFLVSRAYFFETIGFAIGGLLFNFFLVFSSFPLPAHLNSQLLKFRYPDLVETVNSRYGSISVTKTAGQYNFYENGAFLGTNEDIEGSEYFIHTIFAFHQDPKKILLIGGGLNGPLFEILKYTSVEEIDYVELDPKLVEIQTKHLPANLAQILKNPKVNIHFLDGRRFLKLTQKKYDLIIFNLPNPSTALLNRFYTEECFQETKKLLTRDGVFAFTLDVPVDYLSEEAEVLTSSVYKTVKSALSRVLILPEDTSILFLAGSTSLAPNFDLKVDTQYFSREYLRYRLTTKKVGQLESLLTKTEAEINTDFHPTGYFYQTAFWQTTQSFQLARIFKGTEKINWLFFALTAILILLFLKRKLPSPIMTMGIASFTLMTVEILIIFLFQSKLGSLYSKIALIFTTILVSMGLGNLMGSKIISRSSRHPGLKLDSESQRMKILKQARNDACKKTLRFVQLLIILYLLFFFPTIKNLPQEPIFYLLGGIIGFLVGAVFPLANKLYLKRTEKVGVLYSSDLFGAFFGAIFPSIFFIPIFGIPKTVLLLITFNFLSLLK